MRCVPIIAILMSVFVKGSLQQHGREVSNCVWEYQDGSRVDLNELGNDDGTPRWSFKEPLNTDADQNVYTINPCHPFSLETDLECQNVTVCRISLLGTSLNIADASSGHMYHSVDDDAVVLEYNHTDSTDPNLLYISRFVVAKSGQDETQIVVQGITENTPTHVTHRFILLLPNPPSIATALSSTTPPASVSPHPIRTQPSTTPPASISLHPIRTLPSTTPPASISLHPIRTQTPPVTKITIGPPNPPQKNLTAGGVLCIIFVCCLCGYFLIGSFYMFCFSGARGMEIIPHVHFWLDLPNLIMEGFFFIFSCCGTTQTVSSSGGEYDKI